MAWEPGQKDEPQHAQMGKILEPLLYSGHPFVILEAGAADVQIREMKEQAVQESGPVALVIRKGLFQSFEGGSNPGERKGMSREEALEQVLDSLKGNEFCWHDR